MDIAATVIGCGSDGGVESNIPRGDDPSPGNGLSQTNIPESLISAFDSSQTLQAMQRGVDVNSILLDDTFSCYSDNAVGYSTPDISVSVSGTSFSSDQGNGTIDNDESVYVRMTDYGQEFTPEIDDIDYTCYQQGASLEYALHKFRLNTPESGDYDCIDNYSTERQAISLNAALTYETSTGGGIYLYSGITVYDSSRIEFVSGPLDGAYGTYEEDPDSGNQWFSIDDATNFGSANASSYVCSRESTPKPFKQYGIHAAQPVAAPNVALSGLYHVNDFNEYSTDADQYYNNDYLNFRADGYVRLDSPSIYGDSCDRTKPNGLNYCEGYNVTDNTLTVYDTTGEVMTSHDIEFGSNGALASFDAETPSRITPTTRTHIDGVFNNVFLSQSPGCLYLGYCSSTYQSNYYRFSSDGRFVWVSTGDAITDYEEIISRPDAFESFGRR